MGPQISPSTVAGVTLEFCRNGRLLKSAVLRSGRTTFGGALACDFYVRGWPREIIIVVEYDPETDEVFVSASSFGVSIDGFELAIGQRVKFLPGAYVEYIGATLRRANPGRSPAPRPEKATDKASRGLLALYARFTALGAAAKLRPWLFVAAAIIATLPLAYAFVVAPTSRADAGVHAAAVEKASDSSQNINARLLDEVSQRLRSIGSPLSPRLTDDGHVEVSGVANASEIDQAQEVNRRLLDASKSPVRYSVQRLDGNPQIRVAAVVRKPVEAIVLSDRRIYPVGSMLPGEWRIEQITPVSVRLTRDGAVQDVKF